MWRLAEKNTKGYALRSTLFLVFLAMYIARSALRMKSSFVSPSSYSATPKLAVILSI